MPEAASKYAAEPIWCQSVLVEYRLRNHYARGAGNELFSLKTICPSYSFRSACLPEQLAHVLVKLNLPLLQPHWRERSEAQQVCRIPAGGSRRPAQAVRPNPGADRPPTPGLCLGVRFSPRLPGPKAVAGRPVCAWWADFEGWTKAKRLVRSAQAAMTRLPASFLRGNRV